MQEQWFKRYFDKNYLNITRTPFYEKRTLLEVDFIIKALALNETKKMVLDLGCGYGRHLIKIARRLNNSGEFYGLDLSKTLLLAAEKEALKKGCKIKWIRADMRDNSAYPKNLDAIYCMFSTFGYFDEKDNNIVLKNISKSLKYGGLFLLEIPNFYKQIKFFSPYDTSLVTLDDGEKVYIIDERKFSIQENTMEVFRKFIYTRKKTIINRFLKTRLYTIPEIKIMFSDAKMKIKDIFGDLKFGPITQDSNKLYILATKHL